jgi:hypothetical protein
MRTLFLLLSLLLSGCGFPEKEYAVRSDPALLTKLQISAEDWRALELLAAQETGFAIKGAKKDEPDGILIEFKKSGGGWGGPIYWYEIHEGAWRRKNNVSGRWFGPPK